VIGSGRRRRLRRLRLLALSSIAAWCAAGSGRVAAQPLPRPPSTGKELGKPTVVLPAETQARIARLAIKAGDCTGHTAALSTALSLAGDRLSPDERIAANVLLQRCAKASKSWHALIQAALYLLNHAPEKAAADELINAYLALGDEPSAVAALKEIDAKLPAQRANLTTAATLIVCHKNDFASCFAASGKMLEVLQKARPAPTAALFKNSIFHAMSAAALGRYDVYDADMKRADALLAQVHGDPSRLAGLKAAVQQARDARLFVDEDHASELALGTYHLIARGEKIKNTLDNADALVTLRLVNQEPKQRSIKVTVEISGVTDTSTETIALPPGKQVTTMISPPLKIDFDVTKLRAARTSQIAVHLVDPRTGASLLDRTFPVEILPRDSLPLRRSVGSDDLRPTFEYAVAWVTPNAPEIDAFLKLAKARLPGHSAFSGMQQGTLVQVKALFDELKAHGVTYVEDPRIFDERGAVQRTRLPAEVLASTNAQCLEGTLMYASLMEAIGLAPVLVFKTGHAFVAWKPSRYDHTAAPLFFLETTLTGGPATFEQAVESATRSFLEAAQENQFKLGVGALIDVAALRARGYTAQPY